MNIKIEYTDKGVQITFDEPLDFIHLKEKTQRKLPE